MAGNEGSASALALAGRRIDASEAETPRFPLHRLTEVGRALRHVLQRENVAYLVCSAACGADLLALQAAAELGITYRIVLPFDRLRFKGVSVLDRPGDWGGLFDTVVDGAAALGNLVVLAGSGDDADAFTAANKRILAEVQDSPMVRKLAVAVWEGRSRGAGDATAELLDEAADLGFQTLTVQTLD